MAASALALAALAWARPAALALQESGGSDDLRLGAVSHDLGIKPYVFLLWFMTRCSRLAAEQGLQPAEARMLVGMAEALQHFA